MQQIQVHTFAQDMTYKGLIGELCLHLLNDPVGINDMAWDRLNQLADKSGVDLNRANVVDDGRVHYKETSDYYE